MLRQGAAEAGKRPSGAAWRVVRCIHVAASDAEARERVMSEESSYRYYFSYMSTILRGLGRLIALKPHPDMPDDDVTVDKIIESRVIFGAPQTVLEKLVALRNQSGPFGSLLLTGVDWGGIHRKYLGANRTVSEQGAKYFYHHAESESLISSCRAQ